MEPLCVLIVDDHAVFRAGLRLLLSAEPDILVVGEAATGAEAVELADRLRPDAVVMDVHLPDMTGIEATRAITRTNPDVGVLVLTIHDDDESVFAAMRVGARGYLLKDSDPAEIVRSVTAIGTGAAVFGPSVARRLVDHFAALHHIAPRPGVGSTVAFAELTEREREILNLVAGGENNTAIAQRLFLSDKTVRNNVSNILHKLQVADRAQAIVRARRAGLGDLPDPVAGHQGQRTA